jgi:hypothetical protein
MKENSDVLKGCENPKEIFSAFREDGRSVHIEAHFSRAEADNNEYPLAVFGKYSRLKVTVIDKKDTKKKYCEASIQFDKIAGLIANGKYAFDKAMEAKYSAPVGNSPAYTVRMTTGQFVGQTPAEIMSNPENKDDLNKHYAFLADHLNKYPNNQKQMDAIMDAARLMNEGKLEAVSGNAPYITILEAVPLPQIYKEGVVFDKNTGKYINKNREDGLCPVNEIEIVCDTSKKSPYIVTVSNYFAPVVKNMENGKLNAIKKNCADRVDHKFNLTTDEWNDFVRKEAIAEEIFINTYGINQQKDSERWFIKNRNGAIGA